MIEQNVSEEQQPYFRIKPQRIEDSVTGLTFEFQVSHAHEKERYWFVVGGIAVPLGNRDFEFDHYGRLLGRGTCAPPHDGGE